MKIFLDSIGCRLNQSEIEKMGSQFRAAGHTLVDSPLGADLVVVNTCAVTAKAASDSRQKIRQASRSGQTEIIVTGCWSTLSPEAAAALPGVKRVVSNEAKDHLVSKVLNIPKEDFDREPLARQPLPGLHMRTRAFIKAQDGCDNHCTFCITRLARGKGRSRSTSEVIKDIRAALDGGTQEIVLTGVHLGSWGQDFETPQTLRALVETILEQTNPTRLRLSSLEPWDLDEQFFTLWQDARLCRHLHLPLQSGSAATLQRMARKTSPSLFSQLVEMARAVSVDMAITTDIIVGFPGEGEAEFAESLAFVREMDFANGHVFSYSARPGTPAARFSDQIPDALRKQRSAQMRAALARSAQSYRQRFVGCELPVLWEATDSFGPQGWRLQGMTDNYLRVEAQSPERLWNQISRVRLESITAEGLAGTLIPETASAPYPR